MKNKQVNIRFNVEKPRDAAIVRFLQKFTSSYLMSAYIKELIEREMIRLEEDPNG